MKMENQYHSPGPKHIEFGLSLGSKDYPAEKWTMLNTDVYKRQESGIVLQRNKNRKRYC